MNDYISREWLLDVVENIIKWDTERDRNRAIHQVRELTPAADVRPVVRCGECKHCVEHYDTDGNAPYWVCKEWDSGTDYDGYCHYGERKDGDGNV